jgi:hypothetical protein
VSLPFYSCTASIHADRFRQIRETLRLFVPNAQCKHVFFGPCHDNGYLPVLEPYKRDSRVASRLTLIETIEAEPGFKELGLPRVRFPTIFRPQNLPSKPIIPINSNSPAPIRPITNVMNPTPFAAPSPFSPPPPPARSTSSPSPAPSVDSSNGLHSWAAVGKNGAVTKTISIAPTKVKKRFILLNKDDDRLDDRLPEQDSKAYQRFSDMTKSKGNFCNSYHLTGKCDSGEYCDYHHGERLSPGELLVLKHKARSLACPNRYACRDFDCFLGHHCKFAKDCHLGYCRFSDTHGYDLVSPSSLL